MSPKPLILKDSFHKLTVFTVESPVKKVKIVEKQVKIQESQEFILKKKSYSSPVWSFFRKIWSFSFFPEVFGVKS